MRQSVTRKVGENTEEVLLQEFDPNEQQRQKINESNAKLVFSPEFIPFDSNLQRTFDLTHIETLLYGFIRFYTKQASVRFYFSNAQLAYVINSSERTVSQSIKKLNKLGLLNTHYKMKADGGTIRFVEPRDINVIHRVIHNDEKNNNYEKPTSKFCASAPDRTRKFCYPPSQILLPNKNKINNNKYLNKNDFVKVFIKRIEYILGIGQELTKELTDAIKEVPELKKRYGHLLK